MQIYAYVCFNIFYRQGPILPTRIAVDRSMVIMFVVVNFDALAQTRDFQIERRQVVFLCWMQDSNPERLWNRIFSSLNARWQTDPAIEDQAKNSTARAYFQRAFSPLDPTARYMLMFAEICFIVWGPFY